MPRVTAAGDHRIAMAMAVASLISGPLELDDPHCVSKSFPTFWAVWDGLIGATGKEPVT
jgi:3-phosphoshikimate 1-carboxyvinyltransferase